jgi:hypothetical protein
MRKGGFPNLAIFPKVFGQGLNNKFLFFLIVFAGQSCKKMVSNTIGSIAFC